MSGPRRYGQQPGGKRMIAIAAAVIGIVIGLASHRYLGSSGPNPLSRIETTADVANALQDMQSSQQQMIDELQITRDHIAKQQAEIRKLTLDLQDATQKLDTLRNSFASEPAPAIGRR